MRAFAEKHDITFPLLSDNGSTVIKAWGLLNREATGSQVGIPYPGTFVIDRKGAIVSRSFEQAYQERDTAASILLALQQSMTVGPAIEVLGKYVKVGVSQTDVVAAPGHRVTLILDVTPGPKIHVYAPGQKSYVPIEFSLDDSADFKAAAAKYPAPRDFLFAPLKEHVQIYDRPVRLTRDITLALTPDLRRRATAKEALSVSGVLAYQACDDKVCYRPDSVPVKWTFTLTPFER